MFSWPGWVWMCFPARWCFFVTAGRAVVLLVFRLAGCVRLPVYLLALVPLVVHYFNALPSPSLPAGSRCAFLARACWAATFCCGGLLGPPSLVRGVVSGARAFFPQWVRYASLWCGLFGPPLRFGCAVYSAGFATSVFAGVLLLPLDVPLAVLAPSAPLSGSLLFFCLPLRFSCVLRLIFLFMPVPLGPGRFSVPRLAPPLWLPPLPCSWFGGCSLCAPLRWLSCLVRQRGLLESCGLRSSFLFAVVRPSLSSRPAVFGLLPLTVLVPLSCRLVSSAGPLVPPGVVAFFAHSVSPLCSWVFFPCSSAAYFLGSPFSFHSRSPLRSLRLSTWVRVWPP